MNTSSHTTTALSLAEIARRTAERAGDLVRDAFGTGFRIEEKSSHIDLVTEVDRASERLITEELLASVPDSRVCGEEYGASGDDDLSGIRWHVDPIDGTHNFVIGEPSFAVSIGIERDGELVGGVVHDPVHRETFWADDRAAWCNDEPLPSCAEFGGHVGALTSQPLQGMKVRDDDLGDYLRLLRGFGFVRNPGSYALHLAHVASGRATLAFEMAGARPWDIAGGMAIAQAVGCSIVKLAPGTPDYGGWGAHSYLVSRDAELAESVAPRLREYMERGTPPLQFAGEPAGATS